MAYLDMTCDRCAVAGTCPKKGSSPFMLAGGKRVHCRILGGYGRGPIDPAVLSPESRERAEKDGPCLTLAEVPHLDDGHVSWQITKIFSQAVVTDREKPTAILDGLMPKSFR